MIHSLLLDTEPLHRYFLYLLLNTKYLKYNILSSIFYLPIWFIRYIVYFYSKYLFVPSSDYLCPKVPSYVKNCPLRIPSGITLQL